MTFNKKDVLAGSIFIALGLLFGLNSFIDLEFGTPFRMGPGFFPIMLSGLMVLIGAIIALQAINMPSSPISPMPWRATVMILIAPIVFGLTIRELGFIPAIALVTGISAFASSSMRPIPAIAVTVAMILFCIAVFYYGLGLPVRLFGTWLAA